MSENILLGRNRKSGKWEMILDPGENYDAQLRAYQKIAKDIPVNDVFDKVVLGRVQPTSTRLSLITSAEKKAKDESLAETRQNASNAGKDAEERQAKLNAQEGERRAATHEAIIDEKNALINKVRKQTGQPVLTETQTEKAHNELVERLSKPAEKPKAPEPEKVLTQEEELAEKNKLTEAVREQTKPKTDKNNLTVNQK